MSNKDIEESAFSKFSGKAEDYPKFRSEFCLFATTAGSAHPTLGLLGAVIPPAEYLLYATTEEDPNPAAFAFLEAPGPMPGVGAQFAAWEYQASRFEKQALDRTALRKAFIARLDADSTVDMAEPNNSFGISRRSVPWMLAWLDNKFRIATPATIAASLALMDIVFVDNGDMTAKQYMVKHHTTPHRDAAVVMGGALPQTTKVNKLIAGLTQCGQFKEVLLHFNLSYTTALTQTYEILSGLVETYDISRASQRVSSGTGLINQATAADPVIQALLDKMERMEAAMTSWSANAATVSTNKRNVNSKTGAPSGGAPSGGGSTFQQGEAVKKVKPFYCWSHGPNSSHHSRDCQRPAEGHHDEATSAMKMGPAVVPQHEANADTGTTGNYICLADAGMLLNIQPTRSGISVKMPDGSLIRSTHTALLNPPSLPRSACVAHVFPTLSGSLLSIGMLCDHGLTATYDAEQVLIRDSRGAVVLRGIRSSTSRLWMIDLD
eukprot:gene41206-51007_t